MRSGSWELGGVRVTGARHLLHGLPCQDALAFEPLPGGFALAVADGHGDPKHARSDEGSSVAVSVAVAQLSQLAADLQEPTHLLDWAAELRTRLPRRLAWAWNQRVRGRAGHDAPDGRWHPDVVSFGTTLLAALVLEQVAVFLQLGDGDIMLRSHGGELERVFPPDEDHYGGVTHSLAGQDPAATTRLCCRRLDGVQLGLLASDGFGDCLGPLDPVASWLVQQAEGGLEPLLEHLPSWLSAVSAKGNGDDISLGLFQRIAP